MATTCASGCAAQLQGLRGCLAGLQKPRLADTMDDQVRLDNEAMPEEGSRAEVPRTESPALISRTASRTSNESQTLGGPTLLTSKACAAAPDATQKMEKEETEEACVAVADATQKMEKQEKEEDAEDVENSTVALTTGNVSEEEGSVHSTPRNRLDCCTAAPVLPEWDSEDLLNLSAKMGQAAWSGSQEAARFLALSLRRAAELAEPHVTSLADSATDAIKSAAKRALAPSPVAPEVLSRSTWEATSHRALTHPCGSAAPVFPELADFDPAGPGTNAVPPTGQPRTAMLMSQIANMHVQPMRPQFDLAKDAQLRYSLPGLPQKSLSFAVPGTAGLGMAATGRPQPQRMSSAVPATTTHAGFAPQILSAPPSFRLSDGPALVSQPVAAASVPEGPFLSQAAVDIARSVPLPAVEGPSVVQNHARAAGASATLALQVPGDRRPLARNRIRAEVSEAD
ncbi:unnamed protein product [Symbiodinium sp. CCMP2592]|nr:unnamed protein product [Symbiodinium sp. CCMP2592]